VRQRSGEEMKGLLSFEVGIPEGQSLVGQPMFGEGSLEVQQRSEVGIPMEENLEELQKFGELQRGRDLVI